MIITESIFEEQSCYQLKNDQISIWITRDVGPRILGLSYLEKENMLAVLPDLKIPVEGADDYSLRGGHRLWYAPEKPETTYLTDDRPSVITLLEKGLQIQQLVDQKTGIQKSWTVVLAEDTAHVNINHRLTNQGEEAFELAPWAITMLRPGGRGIMPLKTSFDDEHGLLPNRQLVFWPYTEIKSPFLDMTDRVISIQSSLSSGALKVGTPNPSGWLAYLLDGNLFVKRAAFDANAKYLDRGASSQIYCNPNVLELETLGPVTNLSPGEFVDHQETWEIYPEGNWPEEIKKLFAEVGI